MDKNIFQRILNFKNAERAKIEEPAMDVTVSLTDTRRSAKAFSDKLMDEMATISKINELLKCPLVKFNSKTHMKLTLAPKPWLEGGEFSILFDLETNEPICAYFEDNN